MKQESIIASAAVLSLLSLASLIILTVFIIREYKQLGTAMHKNKTVMLIIITTACSALACGFLAPNYMNQALGRPLSYAALGFCAITSATFANGAVLGHLVLLRVRTDPLLIPDGHKKPLTVLTWLTGIAMICNIGGIAITWTMENSESNRMLLNVAYQSINYAGAITGVGILAIDIAYTYYFGKHVYRSKSLLGTGGRANEAIDIIAHEGVVITCWVLLAVILYVSSAVVDDDEAASWLYIIQCLVVAIVCYSWVNLKLKLDNRKAAAKKSSKNVLGLGSNGQILGTSNAKILGSGQVFSNAPAGGQNGHDGVQARGHKDAV